MTIQKTSNTSKTLNQNIIDSSISYNELSFIDLAVITLRHYKLVVFVFILLCLISFFYIQSKKDLYELVSIVKMGTQNKNMPIDTLDNIQLFISHTLIPEISTELSGSDNVNINVSILDKSQSIKLSSHTQKSNVNLASEKHKLLVEAILKKYTKDAENKRSATQALFDQTNLDIIKLERADKSASPALYEARLTIFQQLLNITDTEVVVLNKRSSDINGFNRNKLQIFAIAASLICSIFSAFLFEFCIRVKQKLNS